MLWKLFTQSLRSNWKRKRKMLKILLNMLVKLIVQEIKLKKILKIWKNKQKLKKFNLNKNVKSSTRKFNMILGLSSLSKQNKLKKSNSKNYKNKLSLMSKILKWKKSLITELITNIKRVFKKKYKLKNHLKESKNKLVLEMLELKTKEKNF